MHDDAALIHAILSATPVGMVLVDDVGIVFANKKASEMFGWCDYELIGKSVQILIPDRYSDSHKHYEKAYREHPHAKGMAFDRELMAKRKDGSELPIEVSLTPLCIDERAYVLCSIIDLSERASLEAMRVLNGSLRRSASIDSLTQLPNRQALMEELRYRMSELRQADQNLTVAFLDLDGFKQINDTWGHSLGDQVLIEIAGALTDGMRKTDYVGRLAGDEFLLFFSDLSCESDVTKVLNGVLTSIASIKRVRETPVTIGASIGAVTINMYSDATEDGVIELTDSLMYEAKGEGKGTFSYLDLVKRES